MKVLVTGGSGFIGSHVCARLRELGHVPTVFDRDFDKVPAPIFLGDVCNAEAVSEAVYHADAVMHLAGCLGTQETILNPFPAVSTNILGSLNVFEACARYDKRAVYIAVGNHWMNNPYSISKTAAERFALMFNKERGTKIAVVRGMNAYGPGQKAGPVRKIMPNFIIPALKGEAITVYGDGSQVMDMIYVSDLSDILCKALLNDHGVYDKVFEAGTGVPLTVDQIALEVLAQVNMEDAIRGTRIKHVPMRPGEPLASTVLADPTTLWPLLGDNAPFTCLTDGVAQTIPFYRAQLAQAVTA